MGTWRVNGTETAGIGIDDRGLLYADGLFETIAIRSGEPRFLDRHLRRLNDGLRRLGIQAPAAATLEAELRAAAAGLDHGVAKLIVTRGGGERGYRPPRRAVTTRVVGAQPAEPAPAKNYTNGIRMYECRTRFAASETTAGMKTLARLEQVLARAEWDDAAIAEGLMCNNDGHIVSGTMSNFFCVRAHQLLTPSLRTGGVAGIMRGLVLELAEQAELEAVEVTLRPADLHPADELFVTNSQFGLWPVRRVGGRDFAPPDRSRMLMQLLTAAGVMECAC